MTADTNELDVITNSTRINQHHRAKLLESSFNIQTKSISLHRTQQNCLHLYHYNNQTRISLKAL